MRQAIGIFRSRPILLAAFAFAVMGDPVSSVAYAIEAALRELGGDLSLLLPAMSVVVAIIAVIIVNYHQLVARFPEGGGGAAAAGKAFGEEWAFLPIGALIVDYALTISISVAAGASAVVAYLPGFASSRVLVALALLLLVASLTWLGHGGRVVFAFMTLAFIAVASWLVIHGSIQMAAGGPLGYHARHRSALDSAIAVALAVPVAMALATGVEAPSSAIAQLGQLNDSGRKTFGQVTLLLTLGVVSALTLGIAGLAIHLGVGIPPADSTLIAELARTAGGTVFPAFQGTTALLLLAAASSSFQAGPGLLKALSPGTRATAWQPGILPLVFATSNRHHTPYIGVALYVAVSAAVVLAARAQDQVLVLYYAVSVFVAFIAGLAAMLKFSLQERAWKSAVVNALGAAAVALTLALNLARIYPLASMGATLVIAAVLYLLWIRAGRPRGVSHALREAEAVVEAA